MACKEGSTPVLSVLAAIAEATIVLAVRHILDAPLIESGLLFLLYLHAFYGLFAWQGPRRTGSEDTEVERAGLDRYAGLLALLAVSTTLFVDQTLFEWSRITDPLEQTPEPIWILVVLLGVWVGNVVCIWYSLAYRFPLERREQFEFLFLNTVESPEYHRLWADNTRLGRGLKWTVYLSRLAGVGFAVTLCGLLTATLWLFDSLPEVVVIVSGLIILMARVRGASAGDVNSSLSLNIVNLENTIVTTIPSILRHPKARSSVSIYGMGVLLSAVPYIYAISLAGGQNWLVEELLSDQYEPMVTLSVQSQVVIWTSVVAFGLAGVWSLWFWYILARRFREYRDYWDRTDGRTLVFGTEKSKLGTARYPPTRLMMAGIFFLIPTVSAEFRTTLSSPVNVWVICGMTVVSILFAVYIVYDVRAEPPQPVHTDGSATLDAIFIQFAWIMVGLLQFSPVSDPFSVLFGTLFVLTILFFTYNYPDIKKYGTDRSDFKRYFPLLWRALLFVLLIGSTALILSIPFLSSDYFGLVFWLLIIMAIFDLGGWIAISVFRRK